MTLEYLSPEEIMTVRRRLTSSNLASRDFGSIEPLKPKLFESAVARQHVGIGTSLKYRTIETVGATLFYGLVMNHAFENGNKRTALVTLLVFLERNRVVLNGVSEDEIFEFTTNVAAHNFPIYRSVDRLDADSEVSAIADWISNHSRSLKRGDRPMKFNELRRHLEAQGCEFEKPDKNYIKIRRGSYSFKTGYPRKDFNVDVAEIKKIRRTLQLDDGSGFDSNAFYHLDLAVDDFVNLYRFLLDRLAEA